MFPHEPVDQEMVQHFYLFFRKRDVDELPYVERGSRWVEVLIQEVNHHHLVVELFIYL